MKKQAEDWLTAADDDLRLISKIIDDETLTNLTAFHCQQAIEKSLKCILEEYESRVPKINNIIRLKEMTDKHLKIETDKKLLELINEVYSDTRYPSGIGLMPDGKPDLKLVEQFYNFALNIRNQIINRMQLKK